MIPLFNLIIAALIAFLFYHVAIGFVTQGNTYRIIVLTCFAILALAFRSIGQNVGVIRINGATYVPMQLISVKKPDGQVVRIYAIAWTEFLRRFPCSEVVR